MIDGNAIDQVFLECLANDRTSRDAIIIEGIVHNFAFDIHKLENNRQLIVSWIKMLPSEFLDLNENGGGGWTFLNLCMTKDKSNVWTGLHLRCEQLYCLAAGNDLARFLFPRDMWQSLPGQMPFIIFRTIRSPKPPKPQAR